MTDWIIVGAGLTGATIAERLATRGDRVLVVDRRRHLAGNAYDFVDENGLLQHRYGPHIFHTNSAVVRDYLSRFTAWRPYEHHVVAQLAEGIIPLPFNFTAIERLFPAPRATLLKERLVARYGADARIPILKLSEADDPDVSELAAFIYDRVFRGYTGKHWGLKPEELSPSVTARVPVVMGYDDRYFDDSFQAMPVDGYSAIVAKMLATPGIELALETSFEEVRPRTPSARIVHTGPIDAHYGWRFGHLPYRSVRFESEVRAGGLVLPAASINYPDDRPCTRVTEIRHITGQDAPLTSLTTEYPEAFEEGRNDPFYPVPRAENQELAARYKALARDEGILFCGRLGDYKYLNMDQAVGAALAIAADLTGERQARGGGGA